MEFFDDEDALNAAVPAELKAKVIEARDAYYELLKEVRAARLAAVTEEPKCPDSSCGAGVLRQKCFFDLGGGCPRHEVLRSYGGHVKLARHLESRKAQHG